jgi:hypothetical protein
MKDFEEELKRALRRSDPPESFRERVLARVAAEQQQSISRRVVSIWHRPMLRWAAVAAIVLFGVGGLSYRAHEQRLEEASGRAAKQQVMLALRITGSKLRVAQKRVKSVEGEDRNAGKTL